MRQERKYWSIEHFLPRTLPNPHKIRTLLEKVRKTNFHLWKSNWIELFIIHFNFLFWFISVKGWYLFNSADSCKRLISLTALILYLPYWQQNYSYIVSAKLPTLWTLIMRSLFFTPCECMLQSHCNNWNETLLNLQLCKEWKTLEMQTTFWKQGLECNIINIIIKSVAAVLSVQ